MTSKYLIKKNFSERKGLFLILIVLIFLGTILENISPYLYGRMLDVILIADKHQLFMLILVYIIIGSINQVLGIIESFIGQKLSFDITNDLKKELFRQIISMKFASYCKYDTGELMNRLHGDADGVVSFYMNFITSIVQVVIELIVSIYFILKISIDLSYVALLYITISFMFNFYVRKYYKRLSMEQKKYGDEFFSFQNEVFGNNMGIKSFNLEKKVFSKYLSFIDREYYLLKRAIILNNLNQTVSFILEMISSLLIIYISAVLIGEGSMTIGIMVAFNSYMNKLIVSIHNLMSFRLNKETSDISLDRMEELLLEDSENYDRPFFDLKGGVIDLKNLSFGYKSNHLILNDISLKISKKGLYGIVGRNGSGKSTFAKLLIKFYDSYDGGLAIDGIDYKDISASNIRRFITYVQKDDIYLNDTIKNNLLIAKDDAAENELERVLKLVNLYDYILELDFGMDTDIGENGIKLSGGQKQRLSIARALLRNTPIYIFDEITSNLDGIAENNIMKILKNLSSDYIIMLISHKSSIGNYCDNIMVFEDGKISDIASHDELMKENALYREMFFF